MIHSKYREASTEEIYEMWKEGQMELSPSEINAIIGELVYRLRKGEQKDDQMTQDWFGTKVVLPQGVVPVEQYPPWAQNLFGIYSRALQEVYHEQGTPN